MRISTTITTGGRMPKTRFLSIQMRALIVMETASETMRTWMTITTGGPTVTKSSAEKVVLSMPVSYRMTSMEIWYVTLWMMMMTLMVLMMQTMIFLSIQMSGLTVMRMGSGITLTRSRPMRLSGRIRMGTAWGTTRMLSPST